MMTINISFTLFSLPSAAPRYPVASEQPVTLGSHLLSIRLDDHEPGDRWHVQHEVFHTWRKAALYVTFGVLKMWQIPCPDPARQLLLAVSS
mgnify:CR=1 FL=1